MPDRYIREGFITSERVNNLDLFEQALFVRLLLLVDDFGAYDGRDQVIAAQCFPTRVTEALERVPAMLRTLQRTGLIVRYTNRFRPFIAIMQWSCLRRGARRYPAPPVCNELLELYGRDVSVVGMYNREVGWKNPKGCDDVSILIDEHDRAVVPQPPEWRKVNSDWTPNDYVPPKPRVTQSLKGKGGRAVTARSDYEGPVETGDALPEPELHSLPEPEPPSVPPPKLVTVVTGAQLLAPTAAPTTEVSEKKANGATWSADRGIEGVSEAKRVHWQTMFNDLVISDEIARAGEWLRVNAGEREAVLAGGDLDAFLFRWLLRSDNGKKAERTGRARGGVDA